ncbi:hypothetical protein FA95DRAFT_584038 [Auriscalpium vulgare]|uniref:Uncharacterized protein n=1 Tax=Auriscalpium vulgare TaxID=40419 RepID=A0ACB8REQ7_9AGAM|nr:hypothetical protein FA95DRAFT_584038 [Auriscalpium vulgare]
MLLACSALRESINSCAKTFQLTCQALAKNRSLVRPGHARHASARAHGAATRLSPNGPTRRPPSPAQHPGICTSTPWTLPTPALRGTRVGNYGGTRSTGSRCCGSRTTSNGASQPFSRTNAPQVRCRAECVNSGGQAQDCQQVRGGGLKA